MLIVVARQLLRSEWHTVRAWTNIAYYRRASLTTLIRAKSEGDISDSFVGLSGQRFKALEPKFAALKSRLLDEKEDAVEDSWHRLLKQLKDEIPIVAALGDQAVPEVDFSDLDNATVSFKSEHRKRGVAVIRNVIPEQEALDLKMDLKRYIAENPHTKAFPKDKPAVYELYWSPSQLRARAHPSMLKTQRFLMSFWHSKDPSALLSTSHPCSYADRLRIRQPGDTQFTLGPHVDTGSVERWEEAGYGRGGVYDKIWEGKWEEYDAFEASCRLPIQTDLYNGAGACTMFRMYQGWLSMSHTRAHEGTLLVNPLLGMASAYYLLRPFFTPKRLSNIGDTEVDLHPDNWTLTQPPDSWLQGATPGHCQELTASLHPHLELAKSMIHVPTVRPGDYVAWHCDTIHGVDSVHAGTSDSSVLYIPTCPLTENNARCLKRQRDAFLVGTPGPDFPGGKGESEHVGRWHAEDCEKHLGPEGLKAFALAPWDSDEAGLSMIQRTVLDRANKLLEYYD